MRWLLLFVLGLAAATGRAQTVSERYLLSAINGERAAHGLRALRVDEELHRAAAGHAEEMARRGAISHQFSGEAELSARGAAAGARFSRISENVAEGPTVIGLHEALMRSPGHRANILDPAVDAVGIAVVVRRGQLFAVEDFARTVVRLTLDEQEAAVGALLDRAGLELVAGTRTEARKTCALATGYSGGERPDFVMRYTTGDLGELPETLTRRLRTGRERRAAVGACAPEASAFSQYSVAVLLFR